MVTALAKDVELDIRFEEEVVSIDRSGASVRVSGEESPVIVTTKGKDDQVHNHGCDLVVLTGPIPRLVMGDETANSDVAPVVDATSFEKELFHDKNAMQFMQSLVDIHMQVNVDSRSNTINSSIPISPYKALDYWAAEFSSRGGVIVHRDVGYAETGTQHTIGGIQSYSYLPPPRGGDRDEMWSKQKEWMKRYGYGTEDSGGYEVIGQFYVDTYMYHYDEAGIMAGKPWKLEQYQGLPSTRTLYVGGSVSFETMEDVLGFNLDLVRKFFDESDIFETFV